MINNSRGTVILMAFDLQGLCKALDFSTLLVGDLL